MQLRHSAGGRLGAGRLNRQRARACLFKVGIEAAEIGVGAFAAPHSIIDANRASRYMKNIVPHESARLHEGQSDAVELLHARVGEHAALAAALPSRAMEPEQTIEKRAGAR